MSNHVSELCIKGDLDGLVAYLTSTGKEVQESAEATATPGAATSADADVAAIVTKDDLLRVAANRPDDEGRTALHWALSVKAKPEFIKKLLAPPFSTSPLSYDHDLITPLMTAVSTDCSVEVLEAIVASSAALVDPTTLLEYVNKRDRLGNSALIAAASRGNVRSINFLLGHGAVIDATNKRGQTALHRAVSKGSAEAVEALLAAARKGTTYRNFLNLGDVEGNTPLHYASMENNQELGEVLLRAGAIREKKNKEGKEFWEM